MYICIELSLSLSYMHTQKTSKCIFFILFCFEFLQSFYYTIHTQNILKCAFVMTFLSLSLLYVYLYTKQHKMYIYFSFEFFLFLIRYTKYPKMYICLVWFCISFLYYTYIHKIFQNAHLFSLAWNSFSLIRVHTQNTTKCTFVYAFVLHPVSLSISLTPTHA